MKYFFLLIFLLAGCASVPGEFAESDFVWQSKNIPQKWTQVHKNLAKGFQMCGTSVLDCVPDPDVGEVLCYAYLPGAYGGRSAWVEGTIHIKAVSDKETLVKVGVVNKYDNPVFGTKGRTRDLWLRMAQGETPSCKDEQ
jgi:hypothetical protein